MHCNGPWGVNASFFCLTCRCGTLVAQWASLIIQMFSCSGMLLWHGLFSSHFCILLVFTFILYVPKTNCQAHFDHTLLQPKGQYQCWQQTFLQTADMLKVLHFFMLQLYICFSTPQIHAYLLQAMYHIDTCTCFLGDFWVWRRRVVVLVSTLVSVTPLDMRPQDHFQLCLLWPERCLKQKPQCFLILIKWFLCLNLTRA